MSIRTRSGPDTSDLRLYTRAAHISSARIIHQYSTSFGLATRLLGSSIRPDVENIYALVRIADEIVDGAAFQAGLSLPEQRSLLDALEAETATAIAQGYSSNVVVHSFAMTARASGIDESLTAPFFASMRRDLSPVDFTPAELQEYIYGSAEVVGLMCLRVFLVGTGVSPTERARLEDGARHLGAAFQKINFLRDLAVDWTELGRCYFPGVDPAHLSDRQKLDLISDIDADLAIAGAVIPHLPKSCRRAVAAAHALFGELNDRLRRVPAHELISTRVRVSNPAKVAILLRSSGLRRSGGSR